MGRRLVQLQFLILVGLGLLVLRLGHLQLVRGAHFYRLAEQNRLRLVPEPAPRGLIVDRRGTVLASNHTVFRVAIVPQELDDLTAILKVVSAVVERTASALERE